ncbi:hypothetical protein CPT03_14025 [Pedobacter ginsengisoli]|uniref:Uncharacterized protein n=1 Tax=Pedobacter ginsengisoli TaxID=363852 RepID=A0A2D1U7F4_9SPHI|nr:hypothetical protein [Pedobacter ginsengisoli]ATP57510.1 hypothetical protein CPT03_14025 [Pedobacter ginsengisoli]
MPVETLAAHNSLTIEKPKTVTVAPGPHSLNRRTDLHASFVRPGGGGGGVDFSITNGYYIFGNGGRTIPAGTTSIVISNHGVETVKISWV